MSQDVIVGPVNNSGGTRSRRRRARCGRRWMLRSEPLELTVAQYACLELLGQHPGLSGSDLARATFVTRQSMNLLLQGLERRGLLTRPAARTAARSCQPSSLRPAAHNLRPRAKRCAP